MEGTPDLEVVGGNGIVGSCNVIGEVGFSDITEEIFSSFWFSVSKGIEETERWKGIWMSTLGPQNGCQNGFGLVKGEGRAGDESLKKCTMAVIVIRTIKVRHCRRRKFQGCRSPK